MINKAPNAGLGPQNEQWRQWVEGGVKGLDRRLEDKYGNDIANSLSAIQSSMRLLSNQVSALAGLQTVAAATSVGSIATPPPATFGVFTQPYDSTYDPSVTLDVPTGRALITLTAYMGVTIKTNLASDYGDLSTGVDYEIDGSGDTFPGPAVYAISPVGAAEATATGVTTSAQRSVYVNAGVHTFRARRVTSATYPLPSMARSNWGGIELSVQVIPA